MKKWPTPAGNGDAKGAEKYSRGNQSLVGATKSWPTPRATDGSKGGPNQRGSKGDPMLPTAISQWSTPRAEPATSRNANNKTGGEFLGHQANRWATPTTRDWKDGDLTGGASTVETNGLLGRQAVRTKWPTPTKQDANSSGAMYPKTETHNPGVTLTDAAVRGGMSSRPDPKTLTLGSPTSDGGPALNPQFVEALMGFPIGWTACVSLETQSSHNKPPAPTESCESDSGE